MNGLSASALMMCSIWSAHFFFFNDTATTEIYTLSLHDALPIFLRRAAWTAGALAVAGILAVLAGYIYISRETPTFDSVRDYRSEEHTSELQSQSNIVCRLLLEKKKKIVITSRRTTCSASRPVCT